MIDFAGLPAFRAFLCSPKLSLTLAFFCSDKVQALSYAQHTRQLISCGGDGGIVVWNMDVERQEVRVTRQVTGPLQGRGAGLDPVAPALQRNASASPSGHVLFLL